MEISEIKQILRKASVEVDIHGRGRHLVLFETDFERVAILLKNKGFTTRDAEALFDAYLFNINDKKKSTK